MEVWVLLSLVALKYSRRELVNSDSLYELHTFYITGEPGSYTSMLQLSKQESRGKVISEDNWSTTGQFLGKPLAIQGSL